MSANIFKTTAAALDTRKCCYTVERIHFCSSKKAERRGWLLGESLWLILIVYLRGMNLELWVAPIPGLPCFTGL